MTAVSGCYGFGCLNGNVYLTRYAQVWFAGELSGAASWNGPRHAKASPLPDGAVRAGWFDRQIDPGNTARDSAYLDAKLAGLSVGLALSVPTSFGVNMSVGFSNSGASLRGGGLELGFALPSPPSVSGGATTTWGKLVSAAPRRLW